MLFFASAQIEHIHTVRGCAAMLAGSLQHLKQFGPNSFKVCALLLGVSDLEFQCSGCASFPAGISSIRSSRKSATMLNRSLSML